MSEPTIGPTLRRLRSEAGRSQTEQAELLSAVSGRAVTRNEVSRWENEGRLLTPYWQRHYAATLDVSVEDLRRAVWSARRQRQQRLEPAQDGDDVERRLFLGAAAATAVGWVIPAVTESAAVVGRRTSMATVSELAGRMPRLRRLDNFLGGADTYLLYAAELASARQLLSRTTHSGPVGHALRTLIAEQEQQAGWAAFDAGRNALARKHFADGLSAAQEAREPALAGNALALMAYLAISQGTPAEELAVAARKTAGADAPAPVRALLHEREAWAHAVAGNVDETARALGEAEQALASDDGSPAPDWAAWVDQQEVQIMTGRCWSTLSRPLRAVPVLARVLADFPGTHSRDKALYLTWLASAYLDAGEIEQAASTVEAAMELSSGVSSVRPHERMNAVMSALAPHHGLPSVRRLLDRAAP